MRNDGTYLAQLLQEQQRPHPMYMRQQYHFMGGPGWINDPNGLVWYKDAYHFFYQYNPFGLTWGEPCWGHAVSRDLLHWTQLPPALVPSEPYDMYEQGGCFSGSALVVGQRLYLLYTGVCEKDGHCVQAQCLAWSDDGVTFQKYENNPVVCAPVGVDPANFRDPKLWREADGTFYFVCGASLEGDGAALLFSSQDLFQWQYQGVLARSGGRFGTMWECPDLIPLGRKHMLCVSPMHCPAYRNVCLVGTFSREEGKLLNVGPVCRRRIFWEYRAYFMPLFCQMRRDIFCICAAARALQREMVHHQNFHRSNHLSIKSSQARFALVYCTTISGRHASAAC